MNAPAVPKYVSDAAGDFTDCPPGHRFSLYFPIWKANDWQVDKQGKAAALRQSLKLGSAAKALVALSQRQKTLAEALVADQCFIMEARSTAAFATGLGLEHPIENGFAFLSPYGLPYLAGSGVKGVLRRAAEELRDNEELSQPVIDALFGHENINNARRGALTCLDVFAVPPKDGTHKDSLEVEIMTPHFGDYYQGSSSPHDAGKPNPIPFLAVPVGSTFRFIITCEPTLLTNAVPQGEWKTLLGKIVEHAFDWLGFGAKTAVGYGAMERVSAEEIEKAQRESVAASLKCDWVDATIQALAQKNKIPQNKLGDVLRGKALAEAWAALTDAGLKKRALDDICSRWKKEGWWENPPGKAMKTAKSIYCGEL